MKQFVSKEGYIPLGSQLAEVNTSWYLSWIKGLIQHRACSSQVFMVPNSVASLHLRSFNTSGLEVLAFTIDTDLNYDKIYPSSNLDPVKIVSFVTLCVQTKNYQNFSHSQGIYSIFLCGEGGSSPGFPTGLYHRPAVGLHSADYQLHILLIIRKMCSLRKDFHGFCIYVH